MSLKTVKRLAADILKAGESRVRIVDAKKAGEAMTREDVKGLLKEGVVVLLQKKGVGRGKAKLRQEKRRKGRRRGRGSRKGAKYATLGRKEQWMKRVRAQRRLLKSLKGRLKEGSYKKLYVMVKGNAFKDKRQLDSFIQQNKLLK
jgi:large subunit ribosomal protein L19e